MEHEFNDVDLIDKYLMGELDAEEMEAFGVRYGDDLLFKQEVEVFRKIHEGSQQVAAEKELRETLDHYYEKYADAPIKPVHSLYKRFRIITAIAASLIVIASIYLFTRSPKPPAFNTVVANQKNNNSVSGKKNDTNNNVRQVSVEKPPMKRAVPVADSIKKDPIPTQNDLYAVTGGNILPPEAIRKGSYPQPLRYTFSNGLLTLYGDPLIGLLFLDVYKTGNGYGLQYQSKNYELQEINPQAPELLKPSDKQLTGKVSDMKISIQVAPLPTTPYNGLSVALAGGITSTYRFVSMNHRLILVIGGQFKTTNTQVIKLLVNEKENLYLVSKGQVYSLDTTRHQQSALRALPALNSAAARMLLPRPLVIKTVLLSDN